jgi:hypothetical protein
VKSIRLAEYDKYFKTLLSRPDNPPALFYQKCPTYLRITFSFDNFIIMCDVPYKQIIELYPDVDATDFDVRTSEEEHPSLAKFMHDYLFDRGILEQ